MKTRPIEHIRRIVFDVSQAAFAEIAGTTQPSVSRWEQGLQEPDRTEMEKIRQAALKRGLVWDDRLFFEIPKKFRDSTRRSAPRSPVA
jgi:transcriptional regulator with XRE-family HTH domain